MWHSFLAGWAWALTVLRPPVPVLDCQCNCKCEVAPCPEGSWFWEIIKGAAGLLVVYLSIYWTWGLFLPSWWLPCLDGWKFKRGAIRSPRRLASANQPSVEARAREQLQVLRSRAQNNGSVWRDSCFHLLWSSSSSFVAWATCCG